MTPTPNSPALLPACPLCGDDVTEEQGFADNFGSGPYIYVSCGTCTYQADVPDHRRLSTPAEPKVSREAVLLSGAGWVYHNPDTGWEYASSHPVDSGEVHDATDVRRSTEQEDHLHSQYQAQWERNEALKIALSNPPADGDGWRDISSAPKDGTRVLLFAPTRATPSATIVGWYSQKGREWLSEPGMWQRSPTRWMPLPSAPLGAGGEG